MTYTGSDRELTKERYVHMTLTLKNVWYSDPHCSPDLSEFFFELLQNFRNTAIIKVRNARYNEYLLGKREWKDVYAPIPKPHAFYDPSFTPETHFREN